MVGRPRPRRAAPHLHRAGLDQRAGERLTDLRAHPLQYPGRAPEGDALLTEDGIRPLAADDAVFEDRTPVLAVGSNADPDWLRAKLLRHETSPVVPMTQAEVRGVGVGHSAHVSIPGFVPAAPYDAPRSTAALWVEWFDPDQLEAIDRTEPNYDRRPLDMARYDVALVGSGRELAACAVYVGHHGVLAGLDGEVLALRPQPALLEELLHGDLALAELAGPTPEDWVAATSASAHLRAELKARFEAAGRVASDGLQPWPSRR